MLQSPDFCIQLPFTHATNYPCPRGQGLFDNLVSTFGGVIPRLVLMWSARLEPRGTPQFRLPKAWLSCDYLPTVSPLISSKLRVSHRLAKKAFGTSNTSNANSVIEVRGTMRSISVAGLLAVVSCAAFGQTFEVASIKPAAPPVDGRLMVRMNSEAGRVTYTNVSLRNIITAAYKVKDLQISGPAWMASTRFDVIAKLPAGAKKEDVPAMLQALLADRFKLTLHKEEKVMPAYELLPGKSGPKLKEAEAGGGMRMMMGPRGRHLSGKATLSQLADNLSNALDRPVLDKTGIKGVYDIDLEWSGDEGGMRGLGPLKAGPRPESGSPEVGHDAKIHDESADAPSIFTALQDKLGLKLEARKAPVEMLIIDHAEQVPTEN